jgi:hypothetical protein
MIRNFFFLNKNFIFIFQKVYDLIKTNQLDQAFNSLENEKNPKAIFFDEIVIFLIFFSNLI